MTENKHVRNSFTSQDAVALFKEHTGFEFFATVAGQLLARRGIHKLPGTSRPARFDARNWKTLWEDMRLLALDRCSYDSSVQAPKDCRVPELPQAAQHEHLLAQKTRKPRDEAHHVPAGSTAGSDLRPHPTRRFIEVPFAENTEAKWLGARWDPNFKKWYVPRGLDRKLFRWEDVLLPASMRAVRFTGEKRRKSSSKKEVAKNAPPEVKLAISATRRLDKELDDRLEYLLQESD